MFLLCIFTSIITSHCWAPVASVKKTHHQCKYSPKPGHSSHWHRISVSGWGLLVLKIIRSSLLTFRVALRAFYILFQVTFLILILLQILVFLFLKCALGVINVIFWSYHCVSVACNFFTDSGYSVPGKRNQGKEVFGVNSSVYLVGSKVIYYLLLAGAIGVRRF